MNAQDIKALTIGDRLYLNNPDEYVEIQEIKLDVDNEKKTHTTLSVNNVSMMGVMFHNNRTFLCTCCNAMLWNKVEPAKAVIVPDAVPVTNQ